MTQGRIAGIDFGLKRLGLALSDPNGIIAFPLDTLLAHHKQEETAKRVLLRFQEACKSSRTELIKIIIGMPLTMQGKKGAIADEVAHFVQVLGKLTSIPIETWDERLSSVQAERALLETSMTRKKRSSKVDITAAVIILQSYLDASISKRESL